MGSLRIVGGALRGRRISIPARVTYRPTGERTREALFDILGPSLDGARFLDAFCGTGAIGLEGLSRGAERALFIDEDPEAIASLASLTEAWKVADRARALCLGLPEGLLSSGVGDQAPFSVIFADPPYGTAQLGPFLSAVASRSLLAPTGRLIVERDRRDPLEVAPVGLEHRRTARYGGSCLDFYEPIG
ncbi:MAG: 16S rRNA (guanine(966)-N(2))-methyltransferase RsmD [Acidobacteriota bacterium]|nr:16S rRNA (guanine(966)-N(2))-methyltransferase RsmD [Acidobacteriota bacterium]MDH3784890.1 16S rRNA (guanine(966)-N(2))-methyltransferase RsmD [Acidobacteriota bacterium]